MSIIAEETMTAEEFLALGTDVRAELVEGRMVAMPPAGARHGAIEALLQYALYAWNEAHGQGVVPTADCGFVLSRDPDTVRSPDTAYVSWQRLGGQFPEGLYPVAPELAVEIVSPSDRRAEVLAKISAWLDAGSLVVWVVWPSSESVWVCRPDVDPAILGPADTLTSEDVLPGFALPVARILSAGRPQPRS